MFSNGFLSYGELIQYIMDSLEQEELNDDVDELMSCRFLFLCTNFANKFWIVQDLERFFFILATYVVV